MPLAAAGFAFGDYKLTTNKASEVDIQVYVNSSVMGSLVGDLRGAQIQRANNERMMQEKALRLPAGGSSLSQLDIESGAQGVRTSFAGMDKTMSTELSNTLKVLQSYYGPYPYKSLAVTNVWGSSGPGWPGLLFLDVRSLLDVGQLNALGIKNQAMVTEFLPAHLIAHQWWGQRVGYKSYHDQWLSDGFAEFSELLYVQFRNGTKDSLTQFRSAKELLSRHDVHLRKTETLGPIWMGGRIASTEGDWRSYQDLIFSKGGYVLQMLREQMMDPRNPDPEHVFKEMMQDYGRTYDNKSASTEDFKAIVEKHMRKGMDLDGNHKMDWFFGQYVYGTGIPRYTLHVNLIPTQDGKTTVAGQLIRASVPESWKDVIPVYAHVGDKVMRLGTVAATHATESLNFTIPGKVDKFTMNEYEDLLADVTQ